MPDKVVPMIHVPDVRSTVEWYESIGFNIVATYGDETGEGLSFAIMSFGTSEVMFSEGGETSDKHRREVDLYVNADGVDDLYERLKDRVDVVEGPHDTFYGMREIIIRDLNRFWITFGEESVFTTLMNGISEGKVELVRQAVASGRLEIATLNVALAAAESANQSAEIVQILQDSGATPPPNIDLETLQSYKGKYKGDQGIEAEISINDDRLYVRPSGQQLMSLWPLDQITFKPIAIEGVTITFNVEEGKTVSLTLQQNDHQLSLKRTD